MMPEVIQARIIPQNWKYIQLQADQFIGGWGATTWGGAAIEPTGKGCWCCPTRGTYQNMRTGLQATIVRIEMAGVVEQIGYTTTVSPRNPNLVELILVLDHQTNRNALVDGYQVMVQGTLPGLVNLDNAGRYELLWRQTFDFHDNIAINKLDNTGYYVAGEVKPFHFTLETNIVLDFVTGAGTGTVADLLGNSLHVLGTALNTAGTYIHARIGGQFVWYG